MMSGDKILNFIFICLMSETPSQDGGPIKS